MEAVDGVVTQARCRADRLTASDLQTAPGTASTPTADGSTSNIGSGTTLGGTSFASDFMHQPLKVLCELGGWKSPQTILTCYQQPDEQQIRAALSDRRRVVNSGSPALGPRKTPAQSSKTKRGSHFTKWAWEDLNFRPHAYQAWVRRA